MAALVVMRETAPGERRVAIVPSDVQRLGAIGVTVAIEEGAGHAAGYTDDDYRAAGAQVGDIYGQLSESALAVKVQAPTVEEVDRLPAKSALLSFLAPAAHLDVVARLRDRGLTVLSFDLVPRTSRAQALDALSSQASAAGYQAAVLAANRLGRMMPMLMTAAGTIPPAKVFVLGAGVAGLQAIATAKRLGASVSAYDIRPEAGEEIRSLGARSVELPIEATKGSGGYAAEQSEEFIARQQELVAATVGESDVVITTAAVPGRRAPTLVTEQMVERMRPGSLIIDLASSSGGNCTLTRDGLEVEHSGVLIIAAGDLPSRVASTSSALYSRNVLHTAQILAKEGRWEIDLDDDVIGPMCCVSNGVVRHEPTRIALEGGAF